MPWWAIVDMDAMTVDSCPPPGVPVETKTPAYLPLPSSQYDVEQLEDFQDLEQAIDIPRERLLSLGVGEPYQ